MTHEKAVELAHHAMTNSKSRAHGLIDALIVLGLLDLPADEVAPTVANLTYGSYKVINATSPLLQVTYLATLRTALMDTYGHGPYYIDQIQDALVSSGLKLTAV